MEPFSVDGEWWLSSAPDRRIAGTLRVSEGGQAELSLIGGLRSFMEGGITTTDASGATVTEFGESSMAKAGRYGRILGSSGKHAYTLTNCFQVHRSGSPFGGLASERITVNQVLRGATFDDDESLEFETLHAHMDWLAYWVRQTGIREEFTFREQDNGTVSPLSNAIAIDSIDDERTPGPSGTEIILGQTWAIKGDGVRERSIIQDFYLAVDAGALTPIGDLMTVMGSVQDLVSMGTNRIAAFTELSFRRGDLGRQVGDSFYRDGIDYFADFHARNSGEVRQISDHQMFFSLKDLGGLEGMSRWLVKAATPYRSQLSRVMATRYMSAMYTSDRLLNYAVALEAFDKQKHAGDAIYVERLKRCAALAGAPFADLVGSTDVWAVALKQARNDVAHHNAGIEGSGSRHHFLAESAYILFVLCLLKEGAAPQAAADRMKSYQYFRWLKGRLCEIL